MYTYVLINNCTIFPNVCRVIVVFYEPNNAFSGLDLFTRKEDREETADNMYYIMIHNTNNAHLYIYMYTFVHIVYICICTCSVHTRRSPNWRNKLI